VACARTAVDAVGGDDEVRVRERGLGVDLALEMLRRRLRSIPQNP